MAVETAADLLAQLRDEIGFDVQGGDVTLLGWLNARHRRMVTRSRCYRKRLVIPGGIVAGQADYVLPAEVLEIRSVEVGGVPYDRATRRDTLLARNAMALFISTAGEGAVAQGSNSAGAELLTVYPTPTTGGAELAVFGPVRPPELQVTGVGGGTTNSPVIPAEFFDALVHGAASIGLKREDGRFSDAAAYDAEFTEATEELRRQTRRRWNTGSAQVRIAWPV